jgi:hypothetical protein
MPDPSRRSGKKWLIDALRMTPRLDRGHVLSRRVVRPEVFVLIMAALLWRKK